MEGDVAAVLVALDAGADTALPADAAGQLPAGRRDVRDAVDGLQEHGVGEPDLKWRRIKDLFKLPD